jgi:hypothetical protein
MANALAWISLLAAFVSAAIIAADELRRPQRMSIMNVVWPVTALYFSVFALWAYFARGRAQPRAQRAERRMPMEHDRNSTPPTLWQVTLATSHCGAGCTLGDIFAAFTISALSLTLWGTPLFAEMAGDLAMAWLLGVLFQYLSIQPMQHLAPSEALWAAIQADTLSILAFEVGLFGWMALSYYVLFPAPHLMPQQPLYWLMMQIGMVLGFGTAWPANRLLVRRGVKEKMG